MEKVFVFDLESNGLLDTINTVHTLTIFDGEAYTRYDLSQVEAGVRRLMEADVLVGHNILSYDIPALKIVFPWFDFKGKVIDTLVLAQLAFPDIKSSDFARWRAGKMPGEFIGRHSLEAYGYRLGEHKGSYGKDMENPWEAWSQEMSDYCEQDVKVTWLLWQKLKKKEVPDSVLDLEQKFKVILDRQEARGVKFNEVKAQALYVLLMDRRDKLKKQLHNVYKPFFLRGKEFTPKADNKKMGYKKGCTFTRIKLTEFNPGSRDHIANRLKHLYGWEPTVFTEDGKPQLDEDTLKGLNYPEIPLICEYLMVDKRIGQLAEGKQAWLKKVKKGRIHGRVDSLGAVTRRCTHKDPNLAQVPSVSAPYGAECRELFEASEGFVMLGCDASGLELRCLGHYMHRYDGGAYTLVILEGDIHTVNQLAAGLPTRNDAKRFIYAFLYGAGDELIGVIVGGGAKEGAKIKRTFLNKTPALKKLRKDIAEAVKKGWLRSIDKGVLKVRSPHSALNLLLQSAGAIVMKQACVILDERLQERGFEYHFVLNIHDEWQIEVRPEDAEEIGKMAVQAIRDAGEVLGFRCPLDGEYKIGQNWKETH